MILLGSFKDYFLYIRLDDTQILVIVFPYYDIVLEDDFLKPYTEFYQRMIFQSS